LFLFFASRAAQKGAVFHMLVNILGMIVFYPFLTALGGIMAFWGDNISRQIANAHTFFNIISSVMLLPFLPLSIRLLNKLR
jgi:phosphate:Na+ symporter